MLNYTLKGLLKLQLKLLIIVIYIQDLFVHMPALHTLKQSNPIIYAQFGVSKLNRHIANGNEYGQYKNETKFEKQKKNENFET